MTRHQALSFLLIAVIAGSLACGQQTELPTVLPQADAPTGQPRGFHLGFTPFPYEASSEAVQYVYARLAQDADIIGHHFDNGVPWPEALAGESFSDNIINDWAFRKASTPPGHAVYVAITPISIWRDALAPYRGEEDDMSLPAPWDKHRFNHPDVKAAFLNYAIEIVEFFEPDYLATGIEANLLLNSRPELWADYVELQAYVYEELKARYPDLPIMVSVLGVALLDGYREEDNHAAQLSAFEDLLPYTDFFAISLYPFLSRYLADEIPETIWDDLFGLSDKPIAITETGYPAQTFAALDGAIEVSGSEEKQAAFIERLLAEAEARHFAFVINFILRDYDALYGELTEEQQELGILWRDTGLYNEEGEERPALDIWREALNRPTLDQ